MDSYYEIAIINEEGYTAHDNSWDWSDAVKIANELKKSHNDERVVVTEYKGVGTVYEAEGRRELKYLNPEDLVELLKKYLEFKGKWKHTDSMTGTSVATMWNSM